MLIEVNTLIIGTGILTYALIKKILICTDHYYDKIFLFRNSPSKKYKGVEEECTICLDQLCENNVRTLICKHTFHTKCIDRWFTESNIYACPICKQPSIN
jgi:hypothetical protein